MKTWLFHKELQARIFDSEEDDLETLYAQGWRDTPAAFLEPDTVVEEKPKRGQRKYDRTKSN